MAALKPEFWRQVSASSFKDLTFVRHNLQSGMRAEEGPKTILDAGDTMCVEQPSRTRKAIL